MMKEGFLKAFKFANVLIESNSFSLFSKKLATTSVSLLKFEESPLYIGLVICKTVFHQPSGVIFLLYSTIHKAKEVRA